MRRLTADLHIHTCLSPCGDLSMDPRRVVEMALGAGLDLIAVCDHNSTGNCAAVMQAAEGCALCVLPGCELCTAEEIHVVALFETLTAARDFQGYIDAHLAGSNTPEVFGYQIEADADGQFTAECTDFLIGALDQGVNEVVAAVRHTGGLVICAHIDRPSFSVISQLGFMPPDLAPDAVEVTLPGIHGDFPLSHAAGFPVITASDAHFPEDVGRWTTLFDMDAPVFAELAMALRGEGGRGVAGYGENIASGSSWRTA
ncbi:PHP domain-containing protein [Desulfoluna spongiiphila]|uniref:PHP domain-containing protein n=1 Tax=Desulfoluna spongiiphila TaxID=419481 RepID=UPI00125747AD|nr:PHP-associated domain-containing protein [Desulfoluna spongiiphila]VVS91579.1 php-associated [Desulfoluna spongiiphila]